MKTLILDFLVREAPVQGSAGTHEEATPEAVKAKPSAGVSRLGKCLCGSGHFVLANEMVADPGKGLPASRMFECTGCGEYRLG
jgi:hypothetical protein